MCVFCLERRSSTTWKILVTAEPQGKGGGGSKKKIESLGGMVWKHETCKLAHDQGWWVVGANVPLVNSVRRSIGSIMWQMALMAKNLAGFPMTQRHQRKWRTFTSNIWTMTRWDWFHGERSGRVTRRKNASNNVNSLSKLNGKGMTFQSPGR